MRTSRSPTSSVGDRLRVRPGEQRARRRRRRRGRQRASTSRWSRASRSRSQKARRAGDRRHRQRHRHLRDARRARRRRHAARADRRAWWARRSAAARRSRRLADAVSRGSCPPSSASPCVTFVVWAAVGPAAAPRLRAGQRGRGADHRLPVRARARDADVDHGRRRARARTAGVLFKNAEALEVLEQGRHAGRRQDRDAHRGQAAARRRSARRRRTSMETRRCSRLAAGARARQRAPARRGDRRGAPRARGHVPPAARAFASLTGKGVTGASPAARVALGNRALMADLGVDVDRSWRRAPTRCARESADGDVRRRRRQARRVCWRSPIRSRRRRAGGIAQRCAPTACAS